MSYAAAFARHARLFVTWWLSELAGLVPDRLLHLANRRRLRLLVDLDDGQPRISLLKAGLPTGEAATAVARKGASCHVRLPASAVLRKLLVLPLAAADSLHDVLRFQVDQETPFRSDDVCFDYAIVARNGQAKQIVVDWRLAPRAVVDRARETAEGLGLTVASIGPVDADDAIGAFDFLKGTRSRHPGARKGLRPALGAALAILAAATVAVPLIKKHQAVAAQAEQLVRVRAAAQEALGLRERIAALRDTRDFVLDRRLARPTVSALLRDVTVLVPDDAWLNRLEIKGAEVSIAGLSPATSALVQRVEAHPDFEQATYRSPTMRRSGSGLDEFNLSFRISGGASAP